MTIDFQTFVDTLARAHGRLPISNPFDLSFGGDVARELTYLSRSVTALERSGFALPDSNFEAPTDAAALGRNFRNLRHALADIYRASDDPAVHQSVRRSHGNIRRIDAAIAEGEAA